MSSPLRAGVGSGMSFYFLEEERNFSETAVFVLSFPARPGTAAAGGPDRGVAL